MTGASVYLALGDSITAGYGVGRNHSFATLYFASMSSCLPGLRYYNFGTNGLTTEGLAGKLANSFQLQNLIRKAGIISITIGSNDLLGFSKTALRDGQVNFSTAAARMSNNLQFTGKQLRFLNPDVIILAAALYNPLQAGLFQQTAEEIQALIDQANLILFNWARNFKIRLIPLDRVIWGQEAVMLGADHLHPSLFGHQVIAAEFRKSWVPARYPFFLENNPFSSGLGPNHHRLCFLHN